MLALSWALIASCDQPAGCEVFRNGKFKTAVNGRQYLIDRNGDIQIEHLEGSAKTLKFTVDWIGDCIYTLKPDEKITKQNPAFGKTPLITVNITAVKKGSYIQTTVANFTNKEFTSEFFKLKTKRPQIPGCSAPAA